MVRRLKLLAFVAAVVLMQPWDALAAGHWSAPVDGGMVAGFTFEQATPFERGARRGVDLAAEPGAPVRAACAGVVTHAGPVPGPWRRGVTVRCGALAATHLGLAALAVGRGVRVRRGARLGSSAGRRVRLGARRLADRHGWIDPAALLGTGPAAVPLAPRSPRVPGGAPPRRDRVPVPVRHGPATSAVASSMPLLAWAGLTLAAVALPAGGLVRGRRRRHARRARAMPGTARA